MKELLSPKQVASSIGVSESSLKRWCDQGVIATERTPGGHRRIRIGEVVRFLREQQHPLVQPEVLGLPPGTGSGPRAASKARDALLESLNSGQIDQSRRVVIDQFLAGNSVVRLCEELIAPAMHTIGEEWQCGRIEIYQEHRACEVLNRVLYDLRTILPPTQPGSPLAMGGTPPGDNYRLASLMVELVLVDAGWDAISLGSSLPFSTLTAAAKQQNPRLFWLSFSHVANIDDSVSGFVEFLADTPQTMHVVLGGQQLPTGLPQSDRVHQCTDLGSLRTLLETLKPFDAA